MLERGRKRIINPAFPRLSENSLHDGLALIVDPIGNDVTMGMAFVEVPEGDELRVIIPHPMEVVCGHSSIAIPGATLEFVRRFFLFMMPWTDKRHAKYQYPLDTEVFL